jgi:hypothetical protein
LVTGSGGMQEPLPTMTARFIEILTPNKSKLGL